MVLCLMGLILNPDSRSTNAAPTIRGINVIKQTYQVTGVAWCAGAGVCPSVWTKVYHRTRRSIITTPLALAYKPHLAQHMREAVSFRVATRHTLTLR